MLQGAPLAERPAARSLPNIQGMDILSNYDSLVQILGRCDIIFSNKLTAPPSGGNRTCRRPGARKSPPDSMRTQA